MGNAKNMTEKLLFVSGDMYAYAAYEEIRGWGYKCLFTPNPEEVKNYLKKGKISCIVSDVVFTNTREKGSKYMGITLYNTFAQKVPILLRSIDSLETLEKKVKRNLLHLADDVVDYMDGSMLKLKIQQKLKERYVEGLISGVITPELAGSLGNQKVVERMFYDLFSFAFFWRIAILLTKKSAIREARHLVQ